MDGFSGFFQDRFDSLYYDTGFHDAWSPFGNSITGLFEGVTTGASNVAQGVGKFAQGVGEFMNENTLLLLVLVAGGGVLVYGVSLLKK